MLKRTACAIIAALLLIPLEALASRNPPVPVQPVSINGMLYTVNHAKMGFIEARDAQTGRLKWEKRIYRVWYNPFLERDVQDVYIKSLEVVGGTIEIINEKNRKYLLDTESRKVKKK